MSVTTLAVLSACYEATRQQALLLPLLAAELGVPVNQLFYTWALRQCLQLGTFANNEWRYFFHGLECDIKCLSDSRFLRVDFGPYGAIDTFTAWGILQFIMASMTPWPNFTELKLSFAQTGPPYDHFSGSLDKLSMVWEELETHGLIERADQSLIDLATSHTIVGSDGLQVLSLPSTLPETISFDCSVASRHRISSLGYEMLTRQGVSAG